MCDGGVGGLRHFFQLFEFTFEVEVFVGLGTFFLQSRVLFLRQSLSSSVASCGWLSGLGYCETGGLFGSCARMLSLRLEVVFAAGNSIIKTQLRIFFHMLLCTSCFNGDTIICACKSKISEMCNHQKFSQSRDAVIVIRAYHIFVLLGWAKLLLECELRQTIHITMGHRRKCVKHLQFMSRAMGQNNNWVLQVILIFIYVLANSIDRFFFKRVHTTLSNK